MSQQPVSNLSLSVINDLQHLFEFHGWNLNAEEDKAFKNFCEMLGFLSREQQSCILKITKNFLRVEFDKYRLYLKKAIRQVKANEIENVTKIYVIPINAIEQLIEDKKPVEQRKAPGQSSIPVAYAFRDNYIKDDDIFENKSLHVIFSLEGLPKNINNSSTSMLLLVDDFIGSGKTVDGCLDYLENDLGIDLLKISVLSLVALSDGISRVKSKNVNVYCSEIRYKGITDYFSGFERDSLVKTMSNIEELLGVLEAYHFGYEKSEALVKMNRTPNNTFPVYWHEPRLPNGDKFKAPFSR